jgi:hypothetical protein
VDIAPDESQRSSRLTLMAASDDQRDIRPRRRARERPGGARPLEPGRPFNTADFESSSLSEWELRRDHKILLRGVYVSRATKTTPLLLAQAALVTAPAGSFVSHHTAAQIWGGGVPDHPDVHVTYPKTRAQCHGIFAHRVKRSQIVTTFKGLRLTTPSQTFLDMAQVLNLVDLVVLGDSLVKGGRVSPEELVGFVVGATGPHHRLAKRAAALVRNGVDSPMETRLRLLIVLAGLPEPTVDHRVHDSDGHLLYRFDLSYPEYGLIIEYDGRQHAESTDQWRRDLGRDEQLDEWRIRRLVVVSADLYTTPARTLSRITKAMRERGMTVPPLSDEWRRHFPSRPGDLMVPA